MPSRTSRISRSPVSRSMSSDRLAQSWIRLNLPSGAERPGRRLVVNCSGCHAIDPVPKCFGRQGPILSSDEQPAENLFRNLAPARCARFHPGGPLGNASSAAHRAERRKPIPIGLPQAASCKWLYRQCAGHCPALVVQAVSRALLLQLAFHVRKHARMVKELDLFESNHGCRLNAPIPEKPPKRT